MLCGRVVLNTFSPFVSLKPLDIEFMKQLHQKVNIVPVIARADALTKKEVTELKKRVKCIELALQYTSNSKRLIKCT